MNFNTDEDIVMLSAEGVLLIVNPETGRIESTQFAGFADKVT